MQKTGRERTQRLIARESYAPPAALSGIRNFDRVPSVDAREMCGAGAPLGATIPRSNMTSTDGRSERVGRVLSHLSSTAIAFTAICLAACAPAGARTDSHLHRLVLKLPRTLSKAAGPQRVLGSATLEVPASWINDGLTQDGTVAELHVTVSPACTANIEASTGVEQLKGPPIYEIERAMAAWFSTFEEPAPVPMVTAGTSAPPGLKAPVGQMSNDVWQLDAPTPSSTPQQSPLDGVLVTRLHPRALWASLMLGVRATSGCGLANSSALVPGDLEPVKQDLETILLETTFKATAS
jgi:hypothetical protein